MPLVAPSSKQTLKAGFFGREKSGKTHSSVSLAVAAIKALGLESRVVLVATESWDLDWAPRLAKAGIECATLVDDSGDRVCDPTAVLAGLKEARDGGYQLAILDSMTDLLEAPRHAFIEANHRKEGFGGIKLQEYPTIDRPFKSLCKWLVETRLHWIGTAREKDDKVTQDGVDLSVTKVPKASDWGYATRMIANCQGWRAKGSPDPVHRVAVKDAGGLSAVLENPSTADWGRFLERLK